MNSAIVLRKVSRTYTLHGNVVRALDEVDLEIPAGVLASIVGASGSGKTTLLNVIGGLDRATSGEIYLHGEALHTVSEAHLVEHRRKLLGYIFQSHNLIPNLSAVENVELPLEFARYPRRERRHRAKRCLELAELPSGRWRHRPAQLSGGEQQRVAIARALANDPKIILADEPTGNLDSKTGGQILKLLRDLVDGEGRTIIIITHDREVAAITDMTTELADGAVRRVIQREHNGSR